MTVQTKRKYFEKRVSHYFGNVFKISHLQLEMGYDENDDDNRAYTIYNNLSSGDCQVVISPCKKWLQEKDLTLFEIDRTAFHEVLEAMFAEISNIMESRFIQKDMIPNAMHRVIRNFENNIFPMIKDKK